MNSKDKPKRGEGKTFVRETKPRAAPKAGAGGKAGFSAKEGLGPKKSFAAKAGAEKAAKPVRKLPPPPETMEAEGKPERISKILARVGVASRRDIERMIMEGRVSLNGKVLDTPVVNVTLADKIEVDGMPIRGIERTRLWLYHKPAGLVTTNSDPEGRATVFDNLPEGLPRVLSIGRLDINTEGLLLLTNDGGLSRVLELPTTGWLRRYRVRAHGEIKQEELDKLKEGIAVEGVLYGSIDATLDRTQGSNVWITMGLREGKNREIKNVLGALGLEVNRLIRISYGPFQLGDLPESQVVEVRGRMLRDQLGPRLIEESKANFDAPIYTEAAPEEDEKPARTERSEWAARPEKTERPRAGKPEDRREKALGRPDTRRDDRKFADKPRGAKPFGNRDQEDEDRPKKRPPMGTSRTANVWMAPGARPTTESKTRKSSARAEAEQLFKKPSPQNDRPVIVNRAEEDSDWIRADGPDKQEKGDFGQKRSSGDRPPRGDRPFGDKPRGERSSGDRPRTKSFSGDARAERPRGDRAFGDRPPRSDRPFGDKPRGDRPFADKPRGERSFGDRKPRADGDRPARTFSAEGRPERPRGDRPFGDKPRGDRSFGDKPRGERSFGDRKPREDGERPARSFSAGEGRSERPFSDRPPRGDRPAGDRPFGDKPRNGKPFGGKPGGGKSFGGKPSGSRGKPAGGGGKPGGKTGGRPASGGRPAGGKPRTPRG
ncbi:pseudouridine synthase Rsu [Rhizobium sp. CF080]|uniref:pseudouridine synthase n=1 Tax=Rhizobium sp. (strain CF080) TaxID=1144310 RepID=UPI0003E7EF75|nr:pseudouridine synthase [Rhizobium sp. CF080]EUC01416.1 pseudouridine synthase Rsu [Rhizobium sp. CF080]